MNELSIASAQLVAIATAVSYNADLLIMDEPTSALTEKEVQHLFRIIRDIKSRKGISVIYISHKLDEIFEIADAVTVLRDGRTVSTHPIGNITKDILIHRVGENDAVCVPSGLKLVYPVYRTCLS